jgi:two-component system nitrate/nitrite response regulator NarL
VNDGELEYDSTGEETIAVAVVDDDAIVRDWIRRSLEGTEFHVVGEGSTAAEARGIVQHRKPALLVLDYRLPDQRATDLVRSLRREGITVPALVITAAPEAGLNEAVSEAGAEGVVLKRGDSELLLDAMRSVLSGGAVGDPRNPRRASDESPLSPRERDVLRLAAKGKTNIEIAAELGLGKESVKTFLSRAYTKLGARNRTDAVKRAGERGLL